MHLNLTIIFDKKIFLFFKNNFPKINHCKFIYHKSHLTAYLSFLPCIVCREYLSIIFNVKKCVLYSIKYGIIVKKLFGMFECLFPSLVDKTDPIIQKLTPFVVNSLQQERSCNISEDSFILWAYRTSKLFLEWSRNETKAYKCKKSTYLVQTMLELSSKACLIFLCDIALKNHST